MERPDPSKFHKSGSQVTLSNRFAALSDAPEASLAGEDLDMDLAEGSSSLCLELDMEGFAEVIGLPSGGQAGGGEGKE